SELKFDTTKYHRLIQLRCGERASADPPLSRRITAPYLEHFRAIARYAEKNPRRPIKIEEVEATMPISFVLVKEGVGGHVIGQRTGHPPGVAHRDRLTINGPFVVPDPDALPSRHSLRGSHLPDRGPATPLPKPTLGEPRGDRR